MATPIEKQKVAEEDSDVVAVCGRKEDEWRNNG